MLIGKIKTLKYCLGIAAWGKDIQSKKKLFYTELLNHLDFARAGLRKKVSQMLADSVEGNEVTVNLKTKIGKSLVVKYRLNDYSDYQSLGECLGTMYEIPGIEIDYFIDGGANIGFFGINLLSKKVFKEAILIEPNPHNVKLLNINVGAFEHVTVLPVALSGKDGTVVFEFASSNTGHIKGAVGHEETTSNVLVASRALSTIIPESWNLEKTLLKLDIEGAEYEVLDELLSNKKFPKIIVGEIHDYLGHDGVGLVSSLEYAGYEVKVTGNGMEGNVCRQILAIRK